MQRLRSNRLQLALNNLFQHLFQWLGNLSSNRRRPKQYLTAQQELERKKRLQSQARDCRQSQVNERRQFQTKEHLQDQFKDNEMAFSLNLAALLIAVATIFLTFLSDPTNQTTKPLSLSMGPVGIKISVYAIVSLLGVISIWGAAGIIDYWLDKSNKSWRERQAMYGGGYRIFCSIVSVIAVGLCFLAAQQLSDAVTLLQTGLYLGTGGFMFGKLMDKDDDEPERWGTLLRIFLLLSFVATFFSWVPGGS